MQQNHCLPLLFTYICAIYLYLESSLCYSIIKPILVPFHCKIYLQLYKFPLLTFINFNKHSKTSPDCIHSNIFPLTKTSFAFYLQNRPDAFHIRWVVYIFFFHLKPGDCLINFSSELIHKHWKLNILLMPKITL